MGQRLFNRPANAPQSPRRAVNDAERGAPFMAAHVGNVAERGNKDARIGTGNDQLWHRRPVKFGLLVDCGIKRAFSVSLYRIRRFPLSCFTIKIIGSIVRGLERSLMFFTSKLAIQSEYVGTVVVSFICIPRWASQ